MDETDIRRAESLLACQPPTVLLAESDNAPSRFLLVRVGDVGWAGLEGVTMDAEAAEAIIARFEEHGSSIPIDYHHATEKVQPGQKAPAAGHITKLEFVKGEGLFAAGIEWTDEGRADVESRRFIYTSPAVLWNKETGKVAVITSCALTNTPRTVGAKEILDVAELYKDHETMTKYEKLQKGVKALAEQLHLELAQDEDLPAVTPDTKAISDLMEVLRAKGVDVAPDSSLATILVAAIEFIGMEETTEPETPEEPEEETAEGKPKGKDPAETPEMTKLKVKAAIADKLQERVNVLEKDAAERLAAEKEKTAIKLVAEQVAANRLNPNDESALKAARAMAESNPEGFTELFGSMTPYAPNAPTKGSDVPRGDSRTKELKAAMAEYSTDDTPRRMGFTRPQWMKAHCRQLGIDLPTEDEVKAHCG